MDQRKEVSTVVHHAQAPAAYFLNDGDWRMMLDFGMRAVKSGFLPSGIKTPEQAAIVALKARELNMPFMVGLSHIHVINGRPTLSAEMMQALARKNLPGLVINIIESTDAKATVEFIRPEHGSKPYKLTFTIEDAKRADLLRNPTWTKYPAAMLWSRAVSAGLRKVCPEALIGVSYTPEEMGATVDSDGNVIETTSKTVHDTGETQVVSETNKIQLQRQMVQLANERGVPPKDIKDHLQAKYGVDSSKFLDEEGLRTLIGWIETWSPAPLIPAPWEPDAADLPDPRIVK